jgi:hypothetical protein
MHCCNAAESSSDTVAAVSPFCLTKPYTVCYGLRMPLGKASRKRPLNDLIYE